MSLLEDSLQKTETPMEHQRRIPMSLLEDSLQKTES
jgi:hypothetical protein